MYIFEIVVPGTQLDFRCPTPRASWDMESMLDSLKTLFFEANLALNLFERSMNVPDPDPTLAQYDRQMSRLREIEQLVEQENESLTSSQKYDPGLEARARLKREEWATGKPPTEFEHQISFLYAKAFLSALDGFDRLLKVVAETDGVPQAIAGLHASLETAFPDLRGVRNSAQHHEDRVRSQGVGGRPLDLQPITNGMVPPELPVLALNNIEGSKFCTTMANGHYGEVDITPESMAALRDILQEVLGAFIWTGPKQALPSAPRLALLYRDDA